MKHQRIKNIKKQVKKPRNCDAFMNFKEKNIPMCEGSVVSRLPPPGFELQISILPGKGGYSTRPSGTTGSLVILVCR
jgi:hypothetical protein